MAAHFTREAVNSGALHSSLLPEHVHLVHPLLSPPATVKASRDHGLHRISQYFGSSPFSVQGYRTLLASS